MKMDVVSFNDSGGLSSEIVIGVMKPEADLGMLLDQVSEGGELILLAERGRAVGVLLSRAEYARLKLAATTPAREELATGLAAAGKVPAEAGLDLWDVDEAILEVRQRP